MKKYTSVICVIAAAVFLTSCGSKTTIIQPTKTVYVPVKSKSSGSSNKSTPSSMSGGGASNSNWEAVKAPSNYTPN